MEGMIVKKFLLLIISFTLIFSITSCQGARLLEFERDGVTYYYEYSKGVKTVTNYNPYKFNELPIYQEMVQLGRDVGLVYHSYIYFIYVVDTSIDSDSPNACFHAELDAKTKECLYMYGEYFSTEEEKNAAIERLINIIDTVG